jgi:hypothetical protein
MKADSLEKNALRMSRRGAGTFLPCTPPEGKYLMGLMDRAEITVRNMLTAVEAPLYDIGVLSDLGMLPASTPYRPRGDYISSPSEVS